MLANLRHRLSHFIRHDESASFSVEAVLMFPMLVWAYIAMFVYFEALREQNINLKAAYTIGDLLSRETDVVDGYYMRGMLDIFAWLTRTDQPVSLRVSVIRYDQATDRHMLQWSHGVGGPASLTQEIVDLGLSDHVPIMADADSAIVVETWATFDPFLDVGLTETELNNLVITAPRFTEQLRFRGIGDGTGTTHDDGTSTEDPALGL